jgi:hypothetical protein
VHVHVNDHVGDHVNVNVNVNVKGLTAARWRRCAASHCMFLTDEAPLVSTARR